MSKEEPPPPLNAQAVRESCDRLNKMFGMSEESIEMTFMTSAKMYKMRVDTLIQQDFSRAEAIIIVARRGLE